MAIKRLISAAKTVAQKTGTAINVTKQGNQFLRTTAVSIENPRLQTGIKAYRKTNGNFGISVSQGLLGADFFEGGVSKKGSKLAYGGTAKAPKLSDLTAKARAVKDAVIQKAKDGIAAVKEKLNA